MKTAQDLRAASVLKLCYSKEEIQDFIARRDAVGWTEALLELPPADSCWALAGWLAPEARGQWARACARRAQEYAANTNRAAGAADAADDAADAAEATFHAVYVTAYAARAATIAAIAASHAAAAAARAAFASADAANAAVAADATRNAEYQLAIRHGAMLLEQQLKEIERE